MSTSVTMPALGESVSEGTVTRWLKQEGDQVAVDEPLLEVSTDKVDTEIPSPAAGVLTKIVVAEDETVAVGAELAVIGDAGEGAAGGADSGQQDQPAEQPQQEQQQPAQQEQQAEQPQQDAPQQQEAPQQQSEAQLIYNWEAFPEDVAQLVHAHPTQNEALGEAFLALAGKPLHAHS